MEKDIGRLILIFTASPPKKKLYNHKNYLLSMSRTSLIATPVALPFGLILDGFAPQAVPAMSK